MEELKEQIFHHFSHQHPLELTFICNACNLIIESGRQCYSCKTCSFSLHQVCSSIPRKTHHPAHPNHHLTLLVLPTSANSTFKCKARAHNVAGFYYTCAKCSIYYHVLCSALPLSITINSHVHALKIEFSPPYDFCCDLCNKPSYKGWLYRCRFCEFDAHISCAISQRTKLLETELMQLAVQRFVLGNEETGDQEAADPALSGQTKQYMPSPYAISGDASKDQDPAALVSEDYTIPSYQFSDLCFSIDLVKSYSSHDQTCQTNKHQNDSMASKTSREQQQVQRHDLPKKAVLNPLYKGPENTFNKSFISGTVTHSDEKQSDDKRITNGSLSKSDTSERSIKSDTVSSRWGKFLTCCYHPSYQKCSKSFKNGSCCFRIIDMKYQQDSHRTLTVSLLFFFGSNEIFMIHFQN